VPSSGGNSRTFRKDSAHGRGKMYPQIRVGGEKQGPEGSERLCGRGVVDGLWASFHERRGSGKKGPRGSGRKKTGAEH